MAIKILHNPRCSKSRATLQLLEEQKIQPEVILYLDRTFSLPELKALMGKLGIEDPRLMMRTKDDLYKLLGLDQLDPAIPEQKEKLLQAIVDHSALLERPIVINDNQARIGRPPENVLEIL
ncbi:arsenate reductase (glutaredoxin) [Gallibacterium sp. AGMB14963]|uniref:arsenate reductase (glutaredoxin) n=1 Tax=Gallibacterium faecale TaxID=3019086 RepID=UPI0022F14C12|nr:arsenate reductase (glutaredoxin) [Gallibacterium sp. AGMB14963]MDA3979411.1 arsenate reductase (glutaredoxin) [Gallibacterium sp. AGMB14963]